MDHETTGGLMPDESKRDTSDFQNKALSKTPTFAISLCGILISLSLAFRIMGLDVSTPLNRYMAAKSLAIELEVESGSGRKFEERFIIVEKQLESKLVEIEISVSEIRQDTEQISTVVHGNLKAIDEMKEVAHAPKGKLIYK